MPNQKIILKGIVQKIKSEEKKEITLLLLGNLIADKLILNVN